MRPLILHTGHQIADTVAAAFERGLGCKGRLASAVKDDDVENCSFVVGYGILRGTTPVFRLAEKMGKPWYVVDKGYFGAGHYDGYYRLGKRCTQTYREYDNADSVIMPEPIETNGTCGVICPPTDAVCAFYQINKKQWIKDAIDYVEQRGKQVLVREKGTNRRLADDLSQAAFVYTFNSSVGWQAVAGGIEVVSDPVHSVVGQWGYRTDGDNFIANLLADQFTLKDVEGGKLNDRFTT